MLMRMVAAMRHSRDSIAPVPQRHPPVTINAPSEQADEVLQGPKASEQLPLSPWVGRIRMAAPKPNYFSSYGSLTRMANWIDPKYSPTPTAVESHHMYGPTNCGDNSAPCEFPLPESTPGDSREKNISSSLPVTPAIPPHSTSSQPHPSFGPSPTSPAASPPPVDAEANPHLRTCPFLLSGTRFDVSKLKIHLVSWLDAIIAVSLEDIILAGCSPSQTRKADIQKRGGTLAESEDEAQVIVIDPSARYTFLGRATGALQTVKEGKATVRTYDWLFQCLFRGVVCATMIGEASVEDARATETLFDPYWKAPYQERLMTTERLVLVSTGRDNIQQTLIVPGGWRCWR